MPRRYYSSTAARTTLSGAINSSVTSITVASTSGFPGSFPYTLIIDQDQVTEEIVTVTAASGTTLTVTRGADGTSAVAHDAGAAVNHGVSARDFDEPNAHVNDTTTDVHPQYVRNSLVDAKGDIVTATADNTPARLAVGSNGQVLKANSATSTGLEWGAVESLPSQSGNTGKYLTTNGTSASWATVAADPAFAQSAAYTTSGSWTHPTASASNPKDVLVVLIGGGGGGGGGAAWTVNSNNYGCTGAGGGAGGNATAFYMRATGQSISYTVGAGGTGGTAVSTAGSAVDGNSGGGGGTTSLTNMPITVSADGGSAGGAGSSAGFGTTPYNQTGPAGGAANTYGAGGGRGGGCGSTSGATAATGGSVLAFSSAGLSYTAHNRTPGSGGGGGSTWRNASAALSQSNGAAGGSSTVISSTGGTGGNGAAAASAATATGGAAGTGYGAGGGGGGSAQSNSGTSTSGAGGAGSAGAVIFYYDL